MKREDLRRIIFRIIFTYEFNIDITNREIIDNIITDYGDTTDGERNYIYQKVEAINNNIDKIDKLISDNVTNWKINRISKTDLAILRLAIYEIEFDDDIVKNVAISEAVNIAKEYGTDKSSAFVNGVLGSLKNE